MSPAFILTAGLVAEMTGGRVVAGAADRVLDAVVKDTRTMAAARRTPGIAGPLFIALKGPTYDGHDFVADAITRGVAAVLVAEAPPDPGETTVILVDDTLTALQRLGREVRLRSGARVVAITGSAGKTTTKEATAALLSRKFRVFRNVGNLNNHWGLPLSLIELRDGPDMAVVELGMNHAGEIRTLVGLAEPEVRVWTNVGNAHIGHFGSSDAIAQAKAEILEGATSATVLVANADDARVMHHAAGFAGKVLTFGVDAAADVQARRVDDRGFDGTTADVTSPWGSFTLRLALAGRANLQNVLAAATVALDAGVSTADVTAAAAALAPVDRRGVVHRIAGDVRIVDDSYNASPAAVVQAVRTLAATECRGRRIAVLGEMRELGDTAVALHEDCGRVVAQSGIDELVAVGGPAADGFVTGATLNGLPSSRVHRCDTSGEAAPRVAAMLQAGDLVLVKGSRGTRMDVIVDRVSEVD